MTEKQIRKIFANPMYCLANVEGWEISEGKTIISKEIWIKAAKKIIDENGAQQFLEDLLENLEGKYD